MLCLGAVVVLVLPLKRAGDRTALQHRHRITPSYLLVWYDLRIERKMPKVKGFWNLSRIMDKHDYFSSDSKKSLIRSCMVEANNSNCANVGLTLPISMLCSVDLLIDVSFSSSRSDSPRERRMSQSNIFIMHLSISHGFADYPEIRILYADYYKYRCIFTCK